jgi:Domain of unknown function (DUF5076)
LSERIRSIRKLPAENKDTVSKPGENMSERWMDVPQDVAADPNAEDILRVWGTRDGQVFSVRLEHWDDPAAWGMLLADLARHIARSYFEAGLRNQDATLGRIIAGFRAEIPTDNETADDTQQ